MHAISNTILLLLIQYINIINIMCLLIMCVYNNIIHVCLL